MKNLIKSRRGVAIELAIGAMFVMIALSIVLISISGIQNAHKKNDLENFEEKITLYEITDYIIENKPTEAETYKDYNITLDGSNYIVKNSDGETVLTIGVGQDGKITSWGN